MGDNWFSADRLERRDGRDGNDVVYCCASREIVQGITEALHDRSDCLRTSEVLGEFIRDVRRVQIGKYEDVRLATQGRVRTFCLGHPRGDGRVGLEFAVDEEIAAGSRHLEIAGHHQTQSFGGVTTVEEEQVAFLEGAQDFLHDPGIGGGAAETMAAFECAEAGVRVIPGQYLAKVGLDNVNPGDEYIRIALVQDTEFIADALTRLVKTL